MGLTGVVAALAEEADAFLAGRGEIETGPFQLRRASDCIIATSGIGKANAAAAAAHLASIGCARLIVTGVAGRIGALEGDCFWIAEAVQHDYGALRAKGLARYRAGTIPIGAADRAPFAAMDDPGLGLPHARIASGDVFVEDAVAAAAIAADCEATLVDMETAAVAQVAERLGLPWAAIKAVTDGADAESAEGFQRNLRAAAALAARHAERLAAMHTQN